MRRRRWRQSSRQRDAETTAEELLVDDGWNLVKVEPGTVVVNMNGHDDAIGMGPVVDLVKFTSSRM